MTTARVEELLEGVAAWAREEPGVRAALVLGSQARADTPADEWSDVDVVLFADDPSRLVDDAGWIARFGTPELTFVEETAVGGQRERRVLYADGLEVDFAVFPAGAVGALAASPEPASAIARGRRILHDGLGLEAAFASSTTDPVPRRDPEEIANDFWYHALWAAKKLRRGEGIVARRCVDGILGGLLIELAREHALARDPAADTWHGARFLERWADPRAVAACWAAAGSPAELPDAIRRLCHAFDALAADLLSPDARFDFARDRLRTILP